MWTIGVLALLVAVLSFAGLEPRSALVSCALGWTMLGIAVSDVRRFLVPDILSLPAIPLGLIVSGWLAPEPTDDPVVLWHTAAAIIGALGLYSIGAIYRRVRARQGLGLGDVKLAAVAGAWTGPEGLIRVLLLACAAALTYVLIVGLKGDRKPSGATPIPLGAFLAPSIWIVWIAGQALAR
jgi:leader peptidase (prepilin peptidase)/N-methyltransferase